MKMAFAQAPYGAFELKASYQRNMLRGTLIACAIPIAVMLIIALIGLARSLGGHAEAVTAAADKVYVDLSQLPPPTIKKNIEPPKVMQEKIELPKIGIPNPVPDEQVMEVAVLATKLQREQLAAPEIGEGTGDYTSDNAVIGIMEDILPKADEFIPYDEPPQVLEAPDPVYPEMARKAGMEGMVWVKVLVDKEGKVRDAIVIKDSGMNAGFEEAAVAAAKKRVYRPAMQNNQPVAVWVAFKIRFQLKK